MSFKIKIDFADSPGSHVRADRVEARANLELLKSAQVPGSTAGHAELLIGPSRERAGVRIVGPALPVPEISSQLSKSGICLHKIAIAFGVHDVRQAA